VGPLPRPEGPGRRRADPARTAALRRQQDLARRAVHDRGADARGGRELPNSFLKRQLDIPPGGQRRDAVGIAISLADQADFAVTSLVLLRPIWRWSARDAAEVLAVVTAVHVPLNVVGYAIGARKSLV
jgi:hypothetical protein